MKRNERDIERLDEGGWLGLAKACFPDLVSLSETSAYLVCEHLECLVEVAHRKGDEDFAARCYDFMRWSIRHTSENLQGNIADWFFAGILNSPLSRVRCVDHFDWGDVQLFTAAYTVEPSYEDAVFEQLRVVLQKRWSRHGQLPAPPDPRPGIPPGPR